SSYEREQSGEEVASTGTSHGCDRRRWWSPVSSYFVRRARRNGCKALFLARHLRWRRARADWLPEPARAGSRRRQLDAAFRPDQPHDVRATETARGQLASRLPWGSCGATSTVL